MLTVQSSDTSVDLSDKLQQQQQIETYLNAKANAILNTIFPAQDAFARVSVNLDFNQIKRTRQRYLQDNSEDPLQKDTQSKGVVSHIRETKNSTNTPNSTHSDAQEIDYKVGNEVEQMIIVPGSINALSVSIIVPQNTSTSKMDEIKQLIASAVGANAKRGDQISIAALGHNADAPAENVTTMPVMHPTEPLPHLSPANNTISAQAQLIKLWQTQPLSIKLALMVLCAFAIFGLLSLLICGTVIYRRRAQRLSDKDKEQLLCALNHWLADNRSHHG